MKRNGLLIFIILLLSITTAGAETLYCPLHATLVKTGMTTAEVLAACGPPASRQTTNVNIMRKVPTTQLIYNAINQGSMYLGLTNAIYEQWTLPSGISGNTLSITLINNKVSTINLNGASTGVLSLCNGGTVKIGDPLSTVYNACGNPGIINKTYELQSIPSNSKPEIWVYQFSRYQPPVSLTFLDDKLQSIQK